MHVQWDPEDGSEKQIWNFDSGDVSRKQATQIEKHYDGSWDQWLAGLLQGNIGARSVLLWFMLSTIHPAYKFEDLPDFRVRQLTVQMGVSELADLWKKAKRIKLTPDQREAFRAQFEDDLSDAMVRENRSDPWVIDDGGNLVFQEKKALPKAR